MDPIKFLEGPRIYLRPLEATDLDRCRAWVNTADLRRYLLMVFPIDAKGEQTWFDNLPRGRPPTDIVFAICDQASDAHIGNTGIHRIDWLNRCGETGSFLGDPAHRGRGLGAEAKALFLDYLFETLGLHRIDSITFDHNKASAGHLLRCGFVEEGRKRQALWREGRWHDVRTFGILAEDWAAAREGVWAHIQAKAAQEAAQSK